MGFAASCAYLEKKNGKQSIFTSKMHRDASVAGCAKSELQNLRMNR